MPVVYRVKMLHICQLIDDNCIQPKEGRLASGSPNCKVGCLVYKDWDASGLKARDYAHQKQIGDFEKAKEKGDEEAR